MTPVDHFPKGLATATLTPVHRNQQINHELLFDHCVSLLKRGSSGVVLLGTTGEANSFSLAQRKSILQGLLGHGLDASRIMLGAGCCSLEDTMLLMNDALDQGVRDFLIMPPYYYRNVDEHGIIQYFLELAARLDERPARIYYYHFPRMSGIDLSISALAKLFDKLPNIMIGMKDSSGDLTHMLESLRAIPHIRLYSGTERLLTEAVTAGAVGCISATTNYDPSFAAAVYRHCIAGSDYAHDKAVMLALRSAFEGNVLCCALKGALASEGNPAWQHLKLPLMPLSASELAGVLAGLHALRPLLNQRP